jgi:uncharacterized protein YbjT (DUF2867 family)
MGQAVGPVLVERGHRVTGLVRRGSESRVPSGCTAIAADPFDAASLTPHIPAGATFIHLVGTKHPAPWKGDQFRAIDLRSALASIQAATDARAGHFIYLSVAHPAPVMQAYIRVRQEGEAAIRASGLSATILRPWYVLGPGRQWPLALVPFYKVCESIPATREGARRLGLVTLDDMLAALVSAVEDPRPGIRILDPPAIRQSRLPSKPSKAG